VGGDRGGELLYSGPPAGILQENHSPTGAFLREKKKLDALKNGAH
jgi:excinuclease UvrABC ATPase subunit